MTTTITGRGLTLEIDNEDYEDQASSVVLTMNLERATVDTLTGRSYKVTNTSGTLSVTLYQDWGASGSLCDAIYDAAATDPDTELNFTFVADSGTWTGTVLPNFPASGGAASDVLTTTVEFVVTGTPSMTPPGP